MVSSFVFDMFESIETMSATLKLYKLHPRCGGSITLCKLHRQKQHSCQIPPSSFIWETMCNYDKSACCLSHIEERGLNSDPDENEMSSGQPA